MEVQGQARVARSFVWDELILTECEPTGGFRGTENTPNKMGGGGGDPGPREGWVC